MVVLTQDQSPDFPGFGVRGFSLAVGLLDWQELPAWHAWGWFPFGTDFGHPQANRICEPVRAGHGEAAVRRPLTGNECCAGGARFRAWPGCGVCHVHGSKTHEEYGSVSA